MQYPDERIGERLPHMALSDSARDFWVAAAAAAPVIALAGLVSITDSAVLASTLKRTAAELGRSAAIYWVRYSNTTVILYSFFNLLTQGFVLIVALWALLYNSAPVKGLLVILVEGAGLLVLSVVAITAGRVGGARQQLEEARTKAAADHLADAIGKKFLEPEVIRRFQELVAAGAEPKKAPERGR